MRNPRNTLARSTVFDRSALDFALANDLTSFIIRTFQTVVPGTPYKHNYHIEAIAYALIRCVTGQCRRLVISVPPRSLKSICVSVAFIAWCLGRNPGAHIIGVSYSQDLAVKHARDCRAVMESDWYRRVFPKTLIVIDDPLKPQDATSEAARANLQQWYDSTLLSRVDDKRDDVIIIVQQRLHPDDLVGYVTAREPWEVLSLPAIAEVNEDIPIGHGRVHHRKAGDVLHPERERQEVLDQLRASMGTLAFSAQYLQQPLPIEGNLIRWPWFQAYGDPPSRADGDTIVQSWDTASKPGELNDYSVCTTWLRRDDRHYLLDVYRERIDYPALRRKVVDLARQFGANTVLIEDKGSGTQLIQDLRHDGKLHPIAIKPEADKLTRMATQSAKIEAGSVFLPKEARWLDAFRSEVLQFPHGRHDDQIDSLSQYLGWAKPRVEITAEHFVQGFSPYAEAALAGRDVWDMFSPQWLEAYEARKRGG